MQGKEEEKPEQKLKVKRRWVTYRCISVFKPRKAYGEIDAILLFSINLSKKEEEEDIYSVGFLLIKMIFMLLNSAEILLRTCHDR